MRSFSSRPFLFLLFIITLIACKEQEVTFVQLCDPQLGMGGYEHDENSFQHAVNQINEIKPDFVVICGDLVHDATDSSFNDYLDIRNNLNMPCYEVPGNHDVGKEPSYESLKYYRDKIGDDYYSIEKNGFSFLFVNTQLWKSYLENESEKHDQWFKEELQVCTEKNNPMIIVGHYPIYINDPVEEEKYFNLPPDKRKEILDAFEKFDVKAYLSGHKHELIINNYQNVHLVTGESTSKNFDKRPMGFRLWNVSKDTTIHQFIGLEEN